MTKEEINSLILENEKLAYLISHKYKNKVASFIEFEDLKSTCLLGLVKAANTFDKDKKIKFSTYAYKVIDNEVLMLIRTESSNLKKVNLDDIVTDTINFLDLLPDSTNIEQELISSLDIQYLKLIITCTIKGYKQNEICKLLKISQSQVSRLYSKALNILRYKFERNEDNINE